MVDIPEVAKMDSNDNKNTFFSSNESNAVHNPRRASVSIGYVVPCRSMKLHTLTLLIPKLHLYDLALSFRLHGHSFPKFCAWLLELGRANAIEKT